MKCPKCGYDNPPNSVFCEECDWRLDQKAVATEKHRNPLLFAAVSLALGLIACASYFFGQFTVATIVGALGMVLSGYSINLPRYMGGDKKTICMVMAAVGILANIVGFLFGLVGMVE